MDEGFDLVVIGSGPGGIRAAIQAAKLGKRVLVVEKDRPGGNSVHTGTIPSKSLREAAMAGPKPRFDLAMARMRQSVETEASVVEEQLKRNHVTLLQGTARFLSPQEISVGGRVIAAPHFVIATGTRPIQQDEFPFGPGGAKESDQILSLRKKPRSLLVLGAGVIGCEYASIFARLGVKVTLADRRNELLRSVDHEVIESLRESFTESGIELLLGATVEKMKPARALRSVRLLLNGKKRGFDQILVCMGRQPNTDALDLDKAGIATDARGYIPVDRATFRTKVPHIFAVGDVIGPPGLAAASAEQGRIAACHIFGQTCQAFPESFPYGIYTIPEISWAGHTESELRERNIPYVAGIAPFAELARGIIAGHRTGFIKLLVHPDTRRILGVHALGHGATELVHIGQVTLKLGAPVDFLLENVFNYPTFAEAYKVAALNAANKMRQSNS